MRKAVRIDKDAFGDADGITEELELLAKRQGSIAEGIAHAVVELELCIKSRKNVHSFDW